MPPKTVKKKIGIRKRKGGLDEKYYDKFADYLKTNHNTLYNKIKVMFDLDKTKPNFYITLDQYAYDYLYKHIADHNDDQIIKNGFIESKNTKKAIQDAHQQPMYLAMHLSAPPSQQPQKIILPNPWNIVHTFAVIIKGILDLDLPNLATNIRSIYKNDIKNARNDTKQKTKKNVFFSINLIKNLIRYIKNYKSYFRLTKIQLLDPKHKKFVENYVAYKNTKNSGGRWRWNLVAQTKTKSEFTQLDNFLKSEDTKKFIETANNLVNEAGDINLLESQKNVWTAHYYAIEVLNLLVPTIQEQANGDLDNLEYYLVPTIQDQANGYLDNLEYYLEKLLESIEKKSAIKKHTITVIGGKKTNKRKI